MKTKKQHLNTLISKEIDFSLNERLELFMVKLDLKPADLVKSGISTQQYISNIRTRKRTPNVDFCTRLLIAYPDLRWQWLLAGEGEMLVSKNYVQVEPGIDVVNEGGGCTNPGCAKKIGLLQEELLKERKLIIELQNELLIRSKKETGFENSVQYGQGAKHGKAG